MLLALTAQEGQDLQDRAAMLQQNGIKAAYHSQAAVMELEPALQLPPSGGALLVESDVQLVRHSNIIISAKLGYAKHHSPTPLCHSNAALMLL